LVTNLPAINGLNTPVPARQRTFSNTASSTRTGNSQESLGGQAAPQPQHRRLPRLEGSRRLPEALERVLRDLQIEAAPEAGRQCLEWRRLRDTAAMTSAGVADAR